ncbi:MAG TPA: PIN domain-containing protein [Pirellulales bacterium]|nr:PIN domain-containing protein [Pirellulales bacterium]
MIFVDSGAFLARYLKNDQYHVRAQAAWRRLAKSRERCATTNFVLDETFTLLGRRANYEFAAERARTIYDSSFLLVLRPTKPDELEALDWFEKFSDQQVSFTDCVSFAMMRSNKIKRAFTFDLHFQLAGFAVWP